MQSAFVSAYHAYKSGWKATGEALARRKLRRSGVGGGEEVEVATVGVLASEGDTADRGERVDVDQEVETAAVGVVACESGGNGDGEGRWRFTLGEPGGERSGIDQCPPVPPRDPRMMYVVGGGGEMEADVMYL